jgi:carboxypeptidase Q
VLAESGADRTELQPVLVTHWERGAKESVLLTGAGPLAAVALGGSVPTPAGGLRAPVIELLSLEALKTADVKGKIVFFNRPMNPEPVSTGRAYSEAGDQRNRGPAEAGKYGAVGVLTRSLTLAHDDVPHTGHTGYLPDGPNIPAAALSTMAADRLSSALKQEPTLTVEMNIYSRWFDPAPSHNVFGELRGSEFPEKIILVGGHLDSWDIAPGAHDDGAGIVQSIEVLRLFKAVGYTPRHTLRVVLFADEENGLGGATAYSTAAKAKPEVHVLALESDSGGFQPHAFNLGNPAGNAHLRAARWLPLFEPYGILSFQAGTGGADVGPLLAHGATVAGLTPDSQRYFDYHHTTTDSIDKVNKRELELGAAAMAALVYLVDRNGL